MPSTLDGAPILYGSNRGWRFSVAAVADFGQLCPIGLPPKGFEPPAGFFEAVFHTSSKAVRGRRCVFVDADGFVAFDASSSDGESLVDKVSNEILPCSGSLR